MQTRNQDPSYKPRERPAPEVKQNKTRYIRKSNLLKKRDLSPGQFDKTWKVQKIVRARVKILTKEEKIEREKRLQAKSSDLNPKGQQGKNLDRVKQYEIQWSPAENGKRWENTWEEQDCVPLHVRLQYYRRIRRQQYQKTTARNKKIKAEKQKKKTQRRYLQHLKISNSTPNIPVHQKTLVKNIKEASKQKNQRAKKSDRVSYLNCLEIFEKIVKNFLQKNPKKSRSKSPQEKTGSSRDDSKSIDRDNKQRPNQKIQEQNQELLRNSVVIKKVLQFCGIINQETYFQVQLCDQSTTFISESHLIQNFPKVYSRFLKQKKIELIKNKIQQSEQGKISHQQTSQKNEILKGCQTASSKKQYRYLQEIELERMRSILQNSLSPENQNMSIPIFYQGKQKDVKEYISKDELLKVTGANEPRKTEKIEEKVELSKQKATRRKHSPVKVQKQPKNTSQEKESSPLKSKKIQTQESSISLSIKKQVDSKKESKKRRIEIKEFSNYDQISFQASQGDGSIYYSDEDQ